MRRLNPDDLHDDGALEDLVASKSAIDPLPARQSSVRINRRRR